MSQFYFLSLNFDFVIISI